MILKIKYSFITEVKESVSMLLHKSDYENLRSVIWPTFGTVITFLFTKNNSTKRVGKIWKNNSEKIQSQFNKLNMRDLGNVACLVHGISCEGWFDTDNNSIHVRATESDSDKEIIDTIVHELLHLATYDKKMTYDEREDLVDKYMKRIKI